ncbi:MAG: hypothetical protein WCF92_03045 [bacterium]
MKIRLIIISSIVGTIALIFMLGHIWMISTIEKRYTDTQNLAGNLQLDAMKTQQLSNLKKDIKNFNDKNMALLDLFIKEDDIPNFIESLETIMKNQKVIGVTKSISEASVPELTSASKDQLVISFEAEAPYPNLMQFVSILENLPYKSYISSATLTKETSAQNLGKDLKSTKVNLWKLNLTLNVVKIKTISPAK